MPEWVGFSDASGSPTLRIAVSGQNGPIEFDALIDTGFTGFIMMSIIDAIPLGLVLSGTITVTLADGSGYVKVTAEGTITVQGESRQGTIILEPNPTGILIGMDFLRVFRRVLFIHPNRPLIALLEEAMVDVEFQKYQDSLNQNQPTSSTGPPPPLLQTSPVPLSS